MDFQFDIAYVKKAQLIRAAKVRKIKLIFGIVFCSARYYHIHVRRIRIMRRENSIQFTNTITRDM